jgi:ribonuclease VapC
MVLGSSALLAILFSEPRRASFVAAIDADPVRLMSASTLVECSIVVLARRGPDGLRDLDQLLSRAAIQVEAVDQEQAYIARTAWERFGKGRHAAALNFGDCFSYALAYTTGEALLFAGNDFQQTDVQVHPASARS